MQGRLDELVSSRSQSVDKTAISSFLYKDERWGVLSCLSWDGYRRTVTRKYYRWPILRFPIEQRAAQVSVHLMCPGTGVIVPLCASTCVIKLYSVD
jgi:hypothetical protein